MKNLYLKIINTLTANPQNFQAAGLPPVRHIDIYDAQPENYDHFEFTLPAIFIDYSIAWQPHPGRTKTGNLTLQCHVLTHPFASASSGSDHITNGLTRLTYYQFIADQLEGITTPTTGYLTLQSETPVITDYFTYHCLTFHAPLTRRYKNSTDTNATLENIKIFTT